MKKRLWALCLALVCSFMLAACGETTMDNGRDTNGMPGEPTTGQTKNNNNNMGDGAKSAADGVGNAVKDAANGVGNATKDVVDGATNAIDSAANGVTDAVDNASGNK